jgi:hypothetical protein
MHQVCSDASRVIAGAKARHIRTYFSAMQNKWCAPRISRRLATATGEAMTCSPIRFSAKSSNLSSAWATKTRHPVSRHTACRPQLEARQNIRRRLSGEPLPTNSSLWRDRDTPRLRDPPEHKRAPYIQPESAPTRWFPAAARVYEWQSHRPCRPSGYHRAQPYRLWRRGKQRSKCRLPLPERPPRDNGRRSGG